MTGPGPVIVDVVSVVTEQEPAATVVRYELHNATGRRVWVVDDRWLAWRRADRAVELGLQRVRMRANVRVFGYFPPEVVALGPGERLAREVRLTWPQPLDPLWNAEPQAAPPAGRYLVSVRVGYGFTPGPDDPDLDESVEDPVFGWQRESVSAPVGLEIPDY